MAAQISAVSPRLVFDSSGGGRFLVLFLGSFKRGGGGGGLGFIGATV